MVVVPLPVVSCASAVLDSPVLWSVVAGLRGVGGGGFGWVFGCSARCRGM